MNGFDYGIVGVYLAGLLIMGLMLRKHKSEEDYYLGGRKLGWFPLTLSTMATQLSAISFISAPAFVGLREGGGLKWLSYEFGVPLAMLLVMFVIMPALYRSGVVSIYDYLEKRFGRSTRLFISIAFQISRAFGTGIMVYATALILQAVIGLPFLSSVIVIGVVTLAYSLLGGMKAVVYSDAIQMVLVVIGLVLCLLFALSHVGGFGNMISQVEPSRLMVVDFTVEGLFTDEFSLFAMVFGGIVLYASYYGCDQTQAQRALSAKSLKDIRKLLFANGVLRFPITMLYCMTGLAIGVLAANNPEFLQTIPSDRPDYLMPLFILEYLPHGLIGILIVAILSAAMSSLSSAINSLSAVSLEDINRIRGVENTGESSIGKARYAALFWGVAILFCSAFAGDIAPTVIEAINKVGSALYGPILGVFLIAILNKKTPAMAVNIGLGVGLLLNIYLWKFVPGVFWMWWNVIGLLTTSAIALMLTPLFKPNEVVMPTNDSAVVVADQRSKIIPILTMFFLFIIAISLLMPALPKIFAVS